MGLEGSATPCWFHSCATTPHNVKLELESSCDTHSRRRERACQNSAAVSLGPPMLGGERGLETFLLILPHPETTLPSGDCESATDIDVRVR